MIRAPREEGRDCAAMSGVGKELRRAGVRRAGQRACVGSRSAAGVVPMDWERRLRARLAARRARECPGIGSGRGERPWVPAVTGGAGARPAGRASSSPVLP